VVFNMDGINRSNNSLYQYLVVTVVVLRYMGVPSLEYVPSYTTIRQSLRLLLGLSQSSRPTGRRSSMDTTRHIMDTIGVTWEYLMKRERQKNLSFVRLI
jgi:hypothetical protein